MFMVLHVVDAKMMCVSCLSQFTALAVPAGAGEKKKKPELLSFAGASGLLLRKSRRNRATTLREFWTSGALPYVRVCLATRPSFAMVGTVVEHEVLDTFLLSLLSGVGT
jgi:hypothetical protein